MNMIVFNTGKEQQIIHNDCERNKWLNPKEMLEYGLIDEILTQLPTDK